MNIQMNIQLNHHPNVPQLTILADDLTGAADAAGFFGDLGLTAIVCVDGIATQAGDVVIINTHSRHLTREEAAQKNILAVRSLLALQGSSPPGWIYKKIDSTLRGHPGAELNAIMNTLDYEHALVAPAFPDQGRTTIEGKQLVDGVPLENTTFREQVSSSNLQVLFAAHTNDRQLHSIELSTVQAGVTAVQRLLQEQLPTLYIADAETDQDLRILVKAAIARGIRLFCGSAGLSRALGQVLNLRSLVPAPQIPARKGGPILVMAGSRHPATHRQIELASDRGVAVLSPNSQDMKAIQPVLSLLSQGRDVILTSDKLAAPQQTDQEIAQSLGRISKVISEKVALGGIALTGGDTAMAVLQSLDCDTLRLNGEIEPGIPWGELLAGSQSGLPVATKAGGFGSDQSLTNAIAHLKKNQIRR
jgi:uncharacterized protein YgbK (DUF1537 family)